MARKKSQIPYIPQDDDNKSSADEIAWGKRLNQSKAFQIKHSGDWDENRRLIFNTTPSGSKQGQTPAWMGESDNAISYGWGLYQGLETAVYVQNPDILITSRNPGRMQVASGLTHIVRYDVDQMAVKDIGNLLLLDQFICGYGAIIEDVHTYHKYDEKKEKTGEIEGQEFEGRRIDPKDILFDKNSRRLDLSDCKFVFVAWYPTIQELENDPEITDLPKDIKDYPEASEATRATAQTEGTANTQGAQAARGGAGGEKDEAFKTICVWEIFDKVNQKKLYMTDNKRKIIGEGKWPTNLRFGCRQLFPITLLYQHPVPGSFYPMPEARLIAPQLREMNVLERMVSEDIRTKWRKYLTLAGILTDDQKSQVTDTTLANALIFVDFTKVQEVLGLSATNFTPEQVDLRRLVVPMEDVSPKKDLFQRYEMLEKEIQHIVGYGPAARGGLPSTRSAREAMMINQEKERKLDKRKERITEFYRLFAMKHVRFLQQYLSEERYAPIYQKANEIHQWFSYDREKIQGEFEFEVLAGSSVPKNTEARRASELELYKTVAPVIQATNGDIRPAFYRLAEFYDWDGVDQLFNGMLEKNEALAQALLGFQQGKVPPEALVETATAAMMAVLGPERLKALAQKMQGGGPGQQLAAGADGTRGDPTPQKTAQGVL